MNWWNKKNCFCTVMLLYVIIIVGLKLPLFWKFNFAFSEDFVKIIQDRIMPVLMTIFKGLWVIPLLVIMEIINTKFYMVSALVLSERPGWFFFQHFFSSFRRYQRWSSLCIVTKPTRKGPRSAGYAQTECSHSPFSQSSCFRFFFSTFSFFFTCDSNAQARVKITLVQ